MRIAFRFRAIKGIMSLPARILSHLLQRYSYARLGAMITEHTDQRSREQAIKQIYEDLLREQRISQLVIESPEICVGLQLTQQSLDYVKINFRQFSFYQMLQFIYQYEQSELHDTVLENMLSGVVKSTACEAYLVHAILQKPFSSIGVRIIGSSCHLIKQDRTWAWILDYATDKLYYEYIDLIGRSPQLQRVLQEYVIAPAFLTMKTARVRLLLRLLLTNISLMDVQPALISHIERLFLELQTRGFEWLFLSVLCKISYYLKQGFVQLFIDVFKNIAFSNQLKNKACQKSIVTIFGNIFRQFGQRFYDNHLQYHLILFLVQTLNSVKPLIFDLIYQLQCLNDQDYEIFISSLNANVTKNDTAILQMSSRFIQFHLTKSVYLFQAIVNYLRTHIEISSIFLVKAIIYSVIAAGQLYQGEQQQYMFTYFLEYVPDVIQANISSRDKFYLILALLLGISVAKHQFKIRHNDFSMTKLSISYIVSECHKLEAYNPDFKSLITYCLFTNFYYSISLASDELQCMYDFSYDMINFGLNRIEGASERRVSKNFDSIAAIFQYFSDLVQLNHYYGEELISLVNKCLISNFSHREHSQIQLELISQDFFGLLDSADFYAFNVSYLSAQFMRYLYRREKFAVLCRLLDGVRLLGKSAWYYFDGHLLEVTSNNEVSYPVFSLAIDLFEGYYKQMAISFNYKPEIQRVEINYVASSTLHIVLLYQNVLMEEFKCHIDFGTESNNFVTTRALGVYFIKKDQKQLLSFYFGAEEVFKCNFDLSIYSVYTSIAFVGNQYVSSFSFDYASYRMNLKRRTLTKIISSRENQFAQFTSVFEQVSKANVFFYTVYDLQSGNTGEYLFELALLTFLLHFDKQEFAFAFKYNLLINHEFFEFVLKTAFKMKADDSDYHYIECFSFVFESLIAALSNFTMTMEHCDYLIALSRQYYKIRQGFSWLSALICKILEYECLDAEIKDVLDKVTGYQLVQLMQFYETKNCYVYAQILEVGAKHNLQGNVLQLLEFTLTVQQRKIQEMLFQFLQAGGLLVYCNQLLASNENLQQILFNNVEETNFYLFEGVSQGESYILLFALLSLFYNETKFSQQFRQDNLLLLAKRLILIKPEAFVCFKELIFAPLKYCVDALRGTTSESLYNFIIYFLVDLTGNDLKLHRIAYHGLPLSIYTDLLTECAKRERSDAFNFQVSNIMQIIDCLDESILLQFLSSEDAIYQLIYYQEKTKKKDGDYVEKLVSIILELTTDEAFFLRSIVNDNSRDNFNVRKDFAAQIVYILDYTSLPPECYQKLMTIIGDYQLSFVYRFLYNELQQQLNKVAQQLLTDQKEIQQTILQLQNYKLPSLECQRVACCFKHDPYFVAFNFGLVCPICLNNAPMVRQFNKLLLDLCATQSDCIMYSEQLLFPGKRSLVEKLLLRSSSFYFHPYACGNSDYFLANCLALNQYYHSLIAVYLTPDGSLVMSQPTAVPKLLNQLHDLISFSSERKKIRYGEHSVDEYGRTIKYGLYDYLGDEPDYKYRCIRLKDVRIVIIKQFANYFSCCEIIYNDSRSVMLVFENEADFAYFWASKQMKQVLDSCSSQPNALKAIVKYWKNYEISMFSFILTINYLAGRSYVDLYQYPIFPFINPERKYNLVIGSQNEVVLEKLKEKQSEFISSNNGELMSVFQTFYSHRAITSHYLFQIEPFTTIYRFLYHGIYDCFDRQFVSLSQQWEKVMFGKSFSELIPEFFSSWQFMANMNSLNYNENRFPDVSVSQEKYPEIMKSISAYRISLEYLQATIVDWLYLVFGGATEPGTFPSFVSYYKYSTFETPELNKSLFYGTYPQQILQKTQIPEKKPPPLEFELKERFYADQLIRGELQLAELPTPYVVSPRAKPFISNNKIVGNLVIEQSMYQLNLHTITRVSEYKQYSRVEETALAQQYHFSQQVSTVQVLSHDPQNIELIISTGGRLCLLQGGSVYDLGIEFCDALAVFSETRQLVCVFSGIITTYQLVATTVREIARKEIAYHEKVLQIAVDRHNAKFAILLKMTQCCQIQSYDFLLNYLGQMQLPEDVKLFQFLYYYDVHRWTAFAGYTKAFIVSSDTDEQVFEIEGSYIAIVYPSRNTVHLQNSEKVVQAVQIYALGILY